MSRKFQSTLSMRRATSHTHYKHNQKAISIHALHEESDGVQAGLVLLGIHFNPRSP